MQQKAEVLKSFRENGGVLLPKKLICSQMLPLELPIVERFNKCAEPGN